MGRELTGYALPGWARRWLWVLAMAAIAAILPWIPPLDGEGYRAWLIQATILAGSAIAFDFAAGYIDVVNFGFAGFVGAGAYAAGIVTTRMDWPVWFGLPIGAAFAGLLGLITGVLTLRFRGMFAAMASWFVSLALMGLAANLITITKGPIGLSVPVLFAGTESNLPYYYTGLALVLVTYLGLRTIIDSRAGLAFRAIGQNMDAARSSGIRPARYRIMNFAISCVAAGLFGAFYAHYYGFLTPAVMGTSNTLQVLVTTYVAGRGTLVAPGMFAFAFVFLTDWLNQSFSALPGLSPFIYGALLVITMVLQPRGLAQLLRRAASSTRRGAVRWRAGSRASKEVVSLPADVATGKGTAASESVEPKVTR
jgi:branched-chain amino acid transport system permease protein